MFFARVFLRAFLYERLFSSYVLICLNEKRAQKMLVKSTQGVTTSFIDPFIKLTVFSLSSHTSMFRIGHFSGPQTLQGTL
jgi:hypothetical protein